MDICIYGSCVVRDIIKYTFPKRYNNRLTLGANPISTIIYNDATPPREIYELDTSNWIKKMIANQFKGDVAEQLINSKAEYLILDLADERFNQYCATCESGEVRLADFKIGGDGDWISALKGKGIWAITQVEIDEEYLSNTYKEFVRKILKGFEPNKIILVESYFCEDMLTNEGKFEKYKDDWKVTETNIRLKKCYELFEALIPECNIIKLPTGTYGSCNNIWGVHPLHYPMDIYKYFATSIDIITGHANFLSTPELLCKDCSLNNLLVRKICDYEST